MLDFIKNKSEDIISLLENVGYFLVNEQKKHSYKTFKKEDGSLLTELDLASELLIKAELESLFGNIKVLSEENTQAENELIANEQFCFLLDPIDGTKNFDKGKDFTINLAFCIDKKPVISFIHNPCQKTILFGDENSAFKKTDGKITKLICRSVINKDDKNIFHKKHLKIAIGTHNFENENFKSTIVKHMQNCGYIFDENDFKAFSAMEKLLSFVNNEVDAFWSSTVCKDWDILPALPILKAIKASYHTDNPTLFYNKNFDSGTFIVACDKDLLDNLVNLSKKEECSKLI